MAGLGGAYLSLVYTPMWAENMTAGRGWIALALVVFAAWRPWRAAARRLSVRRRHHPAAPRPGLGGIGGAPQFLSMLPYLATIVVLALISARTRCAGGSTRPPASASRSGRRLDAQAHPEGDQRHDVADPDAGASCSAPRLPACGLPPLGARPAFAADEPLKVGFVYVGPVGDYRLDLPPRRRPQGARGGTSATRSRRPTSRT